MRKQLYIILVSFLLLLVATGCLGPKPVVDGFTSEPPQQGTDDPFKVDVTLSNAGGDGQVEVEVTLVDKQSGQVIRKESNEVEIKENEVQHVLFEMNLPPSAQDLDRQNIEVDVDAHYPIE
jgi:hypothetical protein